MKAFLLTVVALTEVQCAIDYDKMLGPLYEKSDKDKSGKLSWPEFQVAAKNLKLDPNEFTNHGKNLQTFYNSMDKNGDGLTMKELAAGATDNPSYTTYLQGAFTNGAGQTPAIVSSGKLPTAPTKMAEAKAKVVLKVDIAGPPSALYPGERDAILQYFATTCGVTTAEVIMTFLLKKSSRRRLQSSTDSTEISGTAYVADNAAASKALAALPKDKEGFSAVPAFSTVTVEKVEVVAKSDPTLSTSEAVIAIVCLMIAGIGVCTAASIFSKKNAAKEGAEGGCCSAGCCSFFAVKQWAAGEFIGMFAVICCVLFLFTRMNGLTSTIIGLVDTILLLLDLGTKSALTSALVTKVPSAITDTLNSQKATLSLLPVAVIVPGLFCVLFLFLASVCPLSKARPGTYCCTKCMIMLANLFILLSLVFYLIFAALAVVLANLPPALQSSLNMVTGICEIMPPQINQAVTDNKAVIKTLKDMGQAPAALSSLEKTLTDIEDIAAAIDTACGHITQLFVDVNDLFAPAFTCVVALFFAVIMNNGLCCVTGCCKAKPTAEGKVMPEA